MITLRIGLGGTEDSILHVRRDHSLSPPGRTRGLVTLPGRIPDVPLSPAAARSLAH